ncbi:MAG TPA: S41 family peptidase [Sphingobium sp.]|nr:S41 family peptidase [Sphingobium sp.]
MRRHAGALLGLALVLTGCGGGGETAQGGPVVIAPTPTPTPTPTPGPAATCSLSARQDWALAQLREWYLFPETLPAALSPVPYNSLDHYVDALTATARAQGRDRYFTYATSIAAENAYYESGETAGFGFRLGFDEATVTLTIPEVFEDTPAAAAGLERGSRILAIGTNAGNLRTVSAILYQGGTEGLIQALGPDSAGTTRTLRVSDGSGRERIVTLAKTDFDLHPVSGVYGTRLFDNGGRTVGYINLRTFIYSAELPLRNAFATFRQAGVEDVIVDLRYNGGGLVAMARLLGDLLGANRRPDDIFTQLVFRPEKSAENESYLFRPQPQAISPRRIAFIGFEGTASASEGVINAFLPYLSADIALIGANTYGKPVGQIAVDRPECDDRLRIMAFATSNAAGQGDYFHGLAPLMPRTCQAEDDLTYPLGDPREQSVATALDYLAGRACTPIPGALAGLRARSMATQAPAGARLLTPERPAKAREIEAPGVY